MEDFRENRPDPSDSVVLEKEYRGSSSFSQSETPGDKFLISSWAKGDGSLPDSDSMIVGDCPLVTSVSELNKSDTDLFKVVSEISTCFPLPRDTLDGALPSSQMETLDDQLLPTLRTDVLDEMSDSLFGDCEDTPKREASTSSPFDFHGNNPSDSSNSLNSFVSDQIRDSSINLISLQGIAPSPVGAGLDNLGNTCFMNAILQCFTHAVPLVQALSSSSHKNCYDGLGEDFCVFCALRSLVQLSLASPGRVISPYKLANNLNYFSSAFQRFQQEDAHEFLQCFLDKLGKFCLDSKADDNIVEKVFGGRLISKLRCCSCGHSSDTQEPLIDLSLEIENVDSLSSALESFTKVERIEDAETKFTCENCKDEVSMEKQLLLDTTPSVATFQLKRFKVDGCYVEKIDKHVEFPLELDMKPYTTGNQDSNVELKYELYAIVEHSGFSSTSGHYFSFIRSSPDSWYRLDDSKVSRITEDFVLSRDAYILFYVKQGTPWLSNLIAPPKLLSTEALSTSPKSVLDNTGCNNVNEPMNYYSSQTLGPRTFGVEVSESRVFAGPLYEQFCQSQPDDRNGDGSRIDTPSLDVSSPAIGLNKNLHDKSSRGDNKFHKRGINKSEDDDGFCPLTPPRSPSPDIISMETPGTGYKIPRDHLKAAKRSKAEKQPSLDKTLVEDPERREALRYASKSMPSSRRSKLMAAMLGSQSEGPHINNKKKMMAGPAFTRNTHPKHSHSSSVMQYVAAET